MNKITWIGIVYATILACGLIIKLVLSVDEYINTNINEPHSESFSVCTNSNTYWEYIE